MKKIKAAKKYKNFYALLLSNGGGGGGENLQNFVVRGRLRGMAGPWGEVKKAATGISLFSGYSLSSRDSDGMGNRF